MKLVLYIGILGALTSFVTFARAEESVGKLRVEEILLRPTYFSSEGQGGQFSFNDSLVSFEWAKDDHVSAHIMIGSLLQRVIPSIYLETEPKEELGFIEAYAQYTGVYGFVRAGLVPLGFGSSGLEQNHDRIWPKPMLFSERIMGERDYGVSFLTENNGYFAALTVHNGEVDQKPSDGNLWVTTRWGWANERKFQVQISGQAGRTDSDGTAAGSQTLAGWDRTVGAQWRFGAFTLAYRPRNWEFQAQAVLGEREQKSKTDNLTVFQIDALRTLGRNWGVGLRHDEFDPDGKKNNDKVLRESAILFNQSDDATSLVSLVYTKRLEEKYQVHNDEIWFQWRVTPFVK